jgi:superfamily II DNA/RNA helicase
LVPFTRQTLFFSATMPPEITRLTEAFLHNPVRIEVARPASTAATITQGFVASAPGPAKRETLRRLLRQAESFKNAIIFCNRKRDVAVLHKSLQKHGFNAGALHGDMDQRARMASLDCFKTGEVALIVCSDVAARGLDIPDVSHVFNFDVPTHAEDYVHRIGRTGRAGKSGVAISIVTRADEKHVTEIEALIGQKIEWLGGATLDSVVEESAEAGGHEARHRRAPAAQSEARAAGPSRGRKREGAEPKRAASRGKAPEPREPSDRPATAEAAPQRPSRRPKDEDVPVVGLGDHVPSFLLRPVKLKPSKPNAAKEDLDEVPQIG